MPGCHSATVWYQIAAPSKKQARQDPRVHTGYLVSPSSNNAITDPRTVAIEITAAEDIHRHEQERLIQREVRKSKSPKRKPGWTSSKSEERRHFV